MFLRSARIPGRLLPDCNEIAFAHRSDQACRVCARPLRVTLNTRNSPASHTSLDDQALMLAYARGDSTAFDELYERHKGALYRYFARQLPAAEANDCFQSVWLKLINARDGYLPSAPLANYLFTLAHNVLMDHYRVSGRLLSTDPEEFAVPGDNDLRDSPTNGIDEIERSRLQEKLHALIARLPFHQREAWLLQQESNLSHQEISMVTATSEEGVKSRLRYARAKLKAGLKAYVR